MASMVAVLVFFLHDCFPDPLVIFSLSRSLIICSLLCLMLYWMLYFLDSGQLYMPPSRLAVSTDIGLGKADSQQEDSELRI